MSKERLEEVKEKIKFHIDWASNTHYAEINEDELKEYLQLIIEQAERVRELEEENFSLMESLRFNDEELERQNKCYREGIENAIEELTNYSRVSSLLLTRGEVAVITLNKALEGDPNEGG